MSQLEKLLAIKVFVLLFGGKVLLLKMFLVP